MRIADVEVDVEEVLDELGFEYDPAKSTAGWVSVLCPFHEERHPSFRVNYKHGGWVDFHTGDTGSLVSLIANIRNVDDQEAVDWLRQKRISTVEVVDQLIKKLSALKQENKEDMEDLRRWAMYYESLDQNIMAKYFLDRGFTWKTIRKFEVRYSQTERAIIWPVRDRFHNLEGFVMRRIQNGYGSKYLYPRGFKRRFFPLNYYSGPTAVLVEGPLDAMWLHQCGIAGGLALFGTAMSTDQLNELKGLANNVVLALDNDKVGQAAQRNLVKKITHVFGIPRVVRWPEGVKDAQDLSPEQVVDVFSKTTIPFADLSGYNLIGNE